MCSESGLAEVDCAWDRLDGRGLEGCDDRCHVANSIQTQVSNAVNWFCVTLVESLEAIESKMETVIDDHRY